MPVVYTTGIPLTLSAQWYSIQPQSAVYGIAGIPEIYHLGPRLVWYTKL